MNFKKIIIVVFFAFLIIWSFLNQNGRVKGELAESLVVYFLDIGQGDATLVRTPDGNDILIDGGPDNAVLRKLGDYLPLTDHEIEWVVLTHPDSDHVTGLVEVLRRYRVKKVLLTAVLSDTPSYLAFLNEIKKNSIETKVIESPQIIELGQGVYFDILYPDRSFDHQAVTSTNNTSIAGQIIYASTSIMMTGDLEREESLISLGLKLKSDIYHVGHHGSNNANDLSFILQVQPQYAVVSVGADNRYGHPQYRTLKNLAKAQSEIWRTDLSGDLIFSSDGSKFQNLTSP